MGSSPTFGIYMGYKFNLGKAKTGSPYIPDVGEVARQTHGSREDPRQTQHGDRHHARDGQYHARTAAATWSMRTSAR